jgi:hypothetical protein
MKQASQDYLVSRPLSPPNGGLMLFLSHFGRVSFLPLWFTMHLRLGMIAEQTSEPCCGMLRANVVSYT